MAKVSAKGAICKIGSSGGAPSTTIGQVISGTFSLGDVNEVSLTDIDSDFAEWAAGTKEPLEAEIQVLCDSTETGFAAAMTAYTANPATKISFGFTGPSGAGGLILYSDGYVKNVSGFNAGVNAAFTATIKLKGTGAPTYTA